MALHAKLSRQDVQQHCLLLFGRFLFFNFLRQFLKRLALSAEILWCCDFYFDEFLLYSIKKLIRRPFIHPFLFIDRNVTIRVETLFLLFVVPAVVARCAFILEANTNRTITRH